MGNRITLLTLVLCFFLIAWGDRIDRRNIISSSTSTLVGGAASVQHGHSREDQDSAMKIKCIKDLRQLLHQQNEWIKVHAAEFLLKLGYPEGVKEVFLKEEQQFHTKSPYRIGIWRVLAQSSTCTQEKEKWISKIKDAFLDSLGPDRLHAIETLAKLKTSVEQHFPLEVAKALNSTEVPMAVYTKWTTAYTEPQSLEAVRNYFLEQVRSGVNMTDPDQLVTVKLSSYVLRFLGAPEPSSWEDIAIKVLSEESYSPVRSSLLATLYLIHPGNVNPKILNQIKAELKGDISKDTHVSNLMIVLAERGLREDIPFMQRLFDEKRNTDAADYNADVHATAAFSFARLLERMNEQSLQSSDSL